MRVLADLWMINTHGYNVVDVGKQRSAFAMHAIKLVTTKVWLMVNNWLVYHGQVHRVVARVFGCFCPVDDDDTRGAFGIGNQRLVIDKIILAQTLFRHCPTIGRLLKLNLFYVAFCELIEDVHGVLGFVATGC